MTFMWKQQKSIFFGNIKIYGQKREQKKITSILQKLWMQMVCFTPKAMIFLIKWFYCVLVSHNKFKWPSHCLITLLICFSPFFFRFVAEMSLFTIFLYSFFCIQFHVLFCYRSNEKFIKRQWLVTGMCLFIVSIVYRNFPFYF